MRNFKAIARQELKKTASPEKAKLLQRFFKTGRGEYGQGDVFLGVMVPETRKLAKKYRGIGLKDVISVLRSKMHEERLLALLIMVLKFQEGKESEKRKIYDTYLKNTKYINNWDLVDLSAHKIVGEFLFIRSKNTLFKLAKSKSIWERRIAVLATFNFINKNRFRESLMIAEILLRDKEDLIHKAVGWMLREIGKRNLKIEEAFLRKHCSNLPRVMLRYAIERFPKRKRLYYSGKTWQS